MLDSEEETMLAVMAGVTRLSSDSMVRRLVGRRRRVRETLRAGVLDGARRLRTSAGEGGPGHRCST